MSEVISQGSLRLCEHSNSFFVYLVDNECGIANDLTISISKHYIVKSNAIIERLRLINIGSIVNVTTTLSDITRTVLLPASLHYAGMKLIEAEMVDFISKLPESPYLITSLRPDKRIGKFIIYKFTNEVETILDAEIILYVTKRELVESSCVYPKKTKRRMFIR